MKQPLALLQKYWGHSAFRPLQEEIITAVLQQHDTLALLPTGGGKSVCFQIPALAMDGICIVVSPLIALIQDQVANLKANGIKAIALTGGMKFNEISDLLDNCIYGEYKFLYLSPERLQQEIIQERIKQMPVNLIAVDEAHCISQWGNDFRPAYRNIQLLRDLLPTVPCIALTATATTRVLSDIEESLNLRDAKRFQRSFERENISYIVVRTDYKERMILQTVQKYPQSCIIYTRNRKDTVTIHELLQRNHFSSIFYHGGLSAEAKQKHLQLWMQNKVQTMVATNAFGMGIDKPDVKNVIHIQLPESIENYYQEAGRAGRNGEAANAVIITDKRDIAQLRKQHIAQLPDVAFLKLVFRKLCSFFQIAYGEGDQETFALPFYEFCQTYQFSTYQTYAALQLLDRHSIIQMSQNFQRKTTLQFLLKHHELMSYLEKNPQLSLITQAILRTYGGTFEQKITINTNYLSKKLHLGKDAIHNVLTQLEKDEVIYLNAVQTDTEITFLKAREDDKTIHPIAKEVDTQHEQKKSRVEAMIAYVENDQVCKNIQLLSYFGEKTTAACGKCSVCRKQKEKKPDKNLKNSVREAVMSFLHKQEATSAMICHELPFDEQLILEIIQLLLESESIYLTEKNTYCLHI